MIDHLLTNLDKLFTLNFTILAFIATALTILMSFESKTITKFKEAGYFDEIIGYYQKAITWHFSSGLFALVVWLIQYKEYKECQAGLSLIFFIISIFYTYKAYKFLMYFIIKK